MPVLFTILGIILFIVVIVSIPLTVIIDYGEKILVTVKWLFVKIPVYDSTKEKTEEKKPKKEKKSKKSKNTETADAGVKAETKETEAPAEDGQEKDNISSEEPENSSDTAVASTETASSGKGKKKPKNQGNGFLKQLYLDQGYEGIEKMFRALGKSLGGFFGKLYKTFTIDELYITMVTATGDAASTAIKHGKLCAWLYPVLGKLVSTCKVKKYDFDISTDFLASKSTASVYARLHLIPIAVTNGAVVLAVQLAFKILFKLLFAKQKSNKSKKQAIAAEVVAETVNNKDGVSQ